MIAKIIEFSIRNRFLVLLAWLGIAVWGVYAVLHTPVDAIPDLSENQVIVFADWMGRSPQEIEDQITYPLSVQLQGLAGVRTVRSSSEPNFSMISVIFDDATDPYFARTRILERLTTVKNLLPADVTPQLAPDANALGQIFWYTVEGPGRSLDELRAVQDFTVRYQLSSIPGVAEVASVGGFVREYQVDVDPAKLRLYDLPLSAVYAAIANSNMSVGAKAVVQSNTEYLIRGLGWLRGLKDLESVEVANRGGVPITLRQLATVQLGPEFRRSALEKDGQEAVGGVVMMRFGQNPLEVTRAINAKIRELTPGLPAGVRVVPFYERTRLIESAIHTVTGTLKEEMIIASIAILLILTHLRSALVVCVTLPMAVLVSFLFMYYLGIPSNIMSLCGIAISIGILVDAAVVMVENASHQLKEHFGNDKVRGDTTEVVVRSCRLVGRPIFFSVIIMLLSFLPVFALRGMEGKLSHPLAFTKSFAMVGVAIMAITLVPALIPIFIKGRLKGEEQNPIVRSFINIYRPVLTWMVDRPAAVWLLMATLLVLAAGFFKSPVVAQVALAFGLALVVFFVRGALKKLALVASIAALALFADARFPKLGSEFKPDLDEGSLMDMPSASPRIAMAQAVDDVRLRDQVLRSFPEVEQVVGKIGRAETATDPSPVEMVETIITLRPVPQWPRRKINPDDATAQTRALAAELHRRGWLKSDHFDNPPPGSPAAELIHTATDAALAQFDRATREFVRLRQDEHDWAVADDLTHTTIAAIAHQAQSNQGLLRAPTPEDRAVLTKSVRDRAHRLARQPRQEEADALITTLRAEMVRAGILPDRDDLLNDHPGALRAGLTTLRRAFGAPTPNFAERTFAQLESRRAQLTAEGMKSLDHDLFDFAVPQLNAMIVDALLRSARGTEFASPTEPAPADVTRLAHDAAPAFGQRLFLWPKAKSDLQKEMDAELQVPGWGNTWTQPIQNRVNMLATGVRTQIGVKVFGPITTASTGVPTSVGMATTSSITDSIQKMQDISDQIAARLRTIPGAADVITDQAMGKRYLEIQVDREKLQRYGVNIADVNQAIETAMGGSRITMTVEGRQRFPVRLRYARDYWQDPDTIGNVLVTGSATPATLTDFGTSTGAPSPTPKPAASSGMSGGMGGSSASSATAGAMPATPQSAIPNPQSAILQIPLKMLADIRVTEGPAMIKSENGRLRNYVTLNVRDRDLLGFVDEARAALKPIEAQLAGTGMSVEWSGDFEHQMRTNQTMTLILPMVFALIMLLLYVTFRDPLDTGLVLLAVVGALCGAVMFQAVFGFNFSVIVWIGYIAAFGMATQTGVIMLVYLRESLDKHGGLANVDSLATLRQAVIDGAVHRLRPKLLTEGVAIVGLVPMLWATGTGAEIMRPMAAPVLGGLLISDEVIDLLIPVLFYQIRKRRWLKLRTSESETPPAAAPLPEPALAR